MKKHLALFIILLLILPLALGMLTGCTVADETLVVYNWADYIDIALLDEFSAYYEETTGKSLKIIYSTFDTNETMLANVTQGDARVDLICPSEYAIQKLKDKDFLQPFHKENMPNIANLNPIFEQQLDGIFSDYTVEDERLFDYLVPYMWGTLGLIYNSEVISPEQAAEAGWGLLWNSTNIPGVDGTILMKDSIRDVYVATLMYAKEKGDLPEQYMDKSVGTLINTIDDTLLALVERLLIEQRPKLKGYEVDLGKDDMIAGKANVDLAWSGDAIYAISEDEDGKLAYYVPNDTGNVWFDGWVMPKNAQNIAAAEMFVNYMCAPENAMRNMMYIGYTSAVDGAVFQSLEGEEHDAINAILEENDYVWDDFFADDAQYPVELENLGVMRDFQGQNATVVAMWERVKSETNNDMTLPIILAVMFGIALFVLLGYLGYKAMDKKFPKRKYLPKEEGDEPQIPCEAK